MYYCCLTGEWIQRSYTPVLPLVGNYHNEGSEVKLMVKLYNNGAMSSILSSLNIGTLIAWSLSSCYIFWHQIVKAAKDVASPYSQYTESTKKTLI